MGVWKWNFCCFWTASYAWMTECKLVLCMYIVQYFGLCKYLASYLHKYSLCVSVRCIYRYLHKHKLTYIQFSNTLWNEISPGRIHYVANEWERTFLLRNRRRTFFLHKFGTGILLWNWMEWNHKSRRMNEWMSLNVLTSGGMLWYDRSYIIIWIW